MPWGDKPRELFTASQVASFCQVDLKTIHNWAERGEIRHFRTPGRHLRFRRVDLLDFLRKYGYAIPEQVQVGKPRVMILHGNAQTLGTLRRTLRSLFDITTFDHPVDALLAIGAEPPDALVLDDAVAGIDALRVVSRISPSTRRNTSAWSSTPPGCARTKRS